MEAVALLQEAVPVVAPAASAASSSGGRESNDKLQALSEPASDVFAGPENRRHQPGGVVSVVRPATQAGHAALDMCLSGAQLSRGPDRASAREKQRMQRN